MTTAMEMTRTTASRVMAAIKSRIGNDRGEGVISMAIAILVVAALGVAMFTVFQNVGDAAGKKAEDQIDQIQVGE